MAESNGLLNRHRGNSIGGSNPPLSAIFFALMQAPKMKPEKASLHMPSGVLHKTAFQMKLVSFHSTMQSIYCCRCEAQESGQQQFLPHIPETERRYTRRLGGSVQRINIARCAVDCFSLPVSARTMFLLFSIVPMLFRTFVPLFLFEHSSERKSEHKKV